MSGRPQPFPDDDPRHGTERGYRAHRRRNQTPCDPCREACRLTSQQRRIRKGPQRQEVDDARVERILNGDGQLARDATPAERRIVCGRWVARGGKLRHLEALTGWRADRYYRLKDAA